MDDKITNNDNLKIFKFCVYLKYESPVKTVLNETNKNIILELSKGHTSLVEIEILF